MSDEKKVAAETVSKALEKLQGLAKGHSSRGTATTAVETMRDGSAGAGSSAGATQVYHTPSNSDPKGWAGSKGEDCADDGASDSVEADGTDYRGASKGLVKSIFNKLSKGETLTEAEQYVLKSVVKAGYGKADDDKDEDKAEDKMDKAATDDDDEDDEDEKKDKKGKMPFGKSLTDYASENEDVKKGFEMSSFLVGWADVQTQAMQSSESRILSQVQKSLNVVHGEQQSYNSELAKSVSQLAEVLSLQAQRIEQLESTPARGPKSQIAAIEKSFGHGGAGSQSGENLNKSQVLEAMVDMVQKGKISATEVVKFESTSQLAPEMDQAVRAHRSGR